MTEQRTVQRHRVLKGGTIAFNGGGISCTVRNLSDSGAALDVASLLGIPPTFALVIDGEPAARPSRIVWRKEKRIGVAFD
jgi:PilZ domain